MDLQKNKNKIKSQKNGLLKKYLSLVKNKIQIVLLFYPSCLNQGWKDDSTLMLEGIPRLVN